MNKFLPLLSAALLALTATAQASTVDVVLGNTSTSPYAYSTSSSNAALSPNVNLLDTSVTSFTGNTAVVSQTLSIPGYFTAPIGNSYGGTYLAVMGGGTATINIANRNTNDFGFTWASIDSYNSLVLTDARGVSYTLTGQQLLNSLSLASGSQQDVAFIDPFSKIVTAELSSSANSFEASNFSAVPLPASVVMFGMALAGLALVAQRSRKA